MQKFKNIYQEVVFRKYQTSDDIIVTELPRHVQAELKELDMASQKEKELLEKLKKKDDGKAAERIVRLRAQLLASSPVAKVSEVIKVK